jgi:sporulation protein YlmC with PRC-barrel domain
MKHQLLRNMAFCAACVVLGAQAQNSPGTRGNAGSAGGDPVGEKQHPYGAMGHMGHQECRASQLMGANVTGTSGATLGTISDTIINPNPGRIDFAILSLNSASGTGNSPTEGSSLGRSTLSPGAAVVGKQVAVPWMLLRPSSSSSASPAGHQLGFVFSGDTAKLQSAPNFDANADLTQPGWRQSVFTYFGVSGSGSATGAAETPGGIENSSSGSGSSKDIK